MHPKFSSSLLRNTAILLVATAFLFSLPAASWAEDKAKDKKEISQKTDAEKREITYKMLNLFGDVFDRVRQDYVEEVSDEDLVKAALNGMLTSLDPHSNYMDDKEFKEMQVQTKGEFGGLGIEVTMENGLVKVVTPIDDTPAFHAGVKPGDFISHIDDEQVTGMTLQEAVDKMRGKVGSEVKLTILREGQNEPLNLSMKRDKIKIESVTARAEGDVVYLRIRSFSESTHSSLVKEYDRIKGEIGDIKGLVLDLRNNPGGLLDQAVAVSDDFLEQGEIVSTRGRDPSSTTRYNAKEGQISGKDLPMVILVNNGSASAAEIVAGALQDHKRGVVMGTQSFGKGSVQTVIPLANYGAMRLTTARYYTPSGRSIQAEGIEPDIIVEPAKVEPLTSNNLRHEADLRGRLDKDDTASNADKASPKPVDAVKMPAKDKPKNEKEGKPDSTKKDDKSLDVSATEDYQLSRALDLLRGLAVYGARDSH